MVAGLSYQSSLTSPRAFSNPASVLCVLLATAHFKVGSAQCFYLGVNMKLIWYRHKLVSESQLSL